jgi:hypothetical protein
MDSRGRAPGTSFISILSHLVTIFGIPYQQASANATRRFNNLLTDRANNVTGWVTGSLGGIEEIRHRDIECIRNCMERSDRWVAPTTLDHAEHRYADTGPVGDSLKCKFARLSQFMDLSPEVVTESIDWRGLLCTAFQSWRLG